MNKDTKRDREAKSVVRETHTPCVDGFLVRGAGLGVDLKGNEI